MKTRTTRRRCAFERDAWGALGFAIGAVTAAACAPSDQLADGRRLQTPARTQAEVETRDPRDVEDAAKMARAESLSGDAKLDLLDQVASRGGPSSARAAQAARSERLREVQGALDAKDPVTVIANIDRWFPAWKGDPFVASKRALAEDIAYASCAEEICRFSSSRRADAASTTPERSARVASSRAALAAALSVDEIKDEPTLARLKRLGAVIALATQPEIASVDDPAVQAAANDARISAQTQRDKVAFLNADEAVAEELLGSVIDRDATTATVTLDGAAVFLTIDARKKVRGVYLVGLPGTRVIDGTAPTTTRLLAQAMGHAVTIKAPVGAAATSRWNDGSVPIVARWRDGRLMELRVGDVKP
jgi:hypothetical protein